jgi:hypothetical protein
MPHPRYLDVVIACQIPADPYLAEVVIAAQIQDLFFNEEGVRSLGFSGHGLLLISPFSPCAV